jgi:dihydroorotate dehydrogenase (NAD+) catalytic subunit
VTGGLSGPAIRPVAVKLVWEAARVAKVPIIGIGGIMTGRDALEFILAGASAVEVGTANFVDPASAIKVLEGIVGYMTRHRIRSINELIGKLTVD